MDAYFEVLTTGAGLLSLFTLVLLEVILGVDNIIFIAIICGYIPNKKQRKNARTIGLALALIVRVILLSTITFITKMVDPFFHLGHVPITGRGLILFGGGMFLVIKTVNEIYHKFKILDHEEEAKSRQMSWGKAISQIVLIDIVFSFDSIITAVGVTADNPNAQAALATMIMAVVIAMIAMLLFAPFVSDFIERYPTIKMLALSFLVLIGLILIADGLEDAHLLHLSEGADLKVFAYVALLFSGVVEVLNIRLKNVKKRAGVKDI
jgi:predicted tellurium resistance membrane protein TerC